MSNSTLILHTGGKLVTEEELKEAPCPEATATWHPVSHFNVLARVRECLTGNGYEIKAEKFALARDGMRFFGTLDLTVPLAVGVHLAVGIRNSCDKSFPLGFCAGNRVMVCDNLAFSSELLVKRKHTKYGETRFQNAIADASSRLAAFKEAETDRIKQLCAMDLTDDAALAFMVRTVEHKVIASTVLPKVLAEWRKPSFDYGEAGDRPTAWRLLNAYTTALGKRAVANAAEYAGMTVRLNHMLLPHRKAEPATAA